MTFEYNVARMASDGTLYDVYEDETCADLEDAKKQQGWWQGEVDGDPVVVIRRVPYVSAGPWQAVEDGDDGD